MRHRNVPLMCSLRPSRVTPPWALLLLSVLLLSTPSAVAQVNLGQVLDAGGRSLSVEEFKQELVQRVLVGPTPSGGRIEVMYASNGTIQGIGGTPTGGTFVGSGFTAYEGVWTAGSGEAVCSTSNFRPSGGGVAGTSPPLSILVQDRRPLLPVRLRF